MQLDEKELWLRLLVPCVTAALQDFMQLPVPSDGSGLTKPGEFMFEFLGQMKISVETVDMFTAVWGAHLNNLTHMR